MDDAQSLCHTRWDCKYHIVWIPKCRRKILFGRMRKHLADLLHSLARQKECKILEGHLQPDHIHILISIPPKYSVAQVIGFMKGKSAIHIARMYLWSEKELYRDALLGPRLLCINRWRRRRNNCQLHKKPGRRRQTLGPTDILHRRLTITCGGRIIF